MTGNKKSLDSVNPEEVVLGSLKCLGRRRRCTGSIKHELIDEGYSIIERMELFGRFKEKMVSKLIVEKA